MRLSLSCCCRVVVVTDIQHSLRPLLLFVRFKDEADPKAQRTSRTARSQSEHFRVLVALLLRVCRG